MLDGSLVVLVLALPLALVLAISPGGARSRWLRQLAVLGLLLIAQQSSARRLGLDTAHARQLAVVLGRLVLLAGGLAWRSSAANERQG